MRVCMCKSTEIDRGGYPARGEAGPAVQGGGRSVCFSSQG